MYTVSHSGGSFRNGNFRAPPPKPGRLKSAIVSSNNPTEGYTLVSGHERPKYFRRPILPHLQAEPPQVLLAPVPVPSTVKKRLQEEEMDAPTRSIGMQTMYRDSDMQTDPYSPDYTIKQSVSNAPPEVLSLQQLRHQQGLPAGRAEIELIERNRKKTLFDASLPPMTDEASFLLRKSMLEAQELREWAFRESEIDQLHEQRVVLLKQALVERDKENEFLSEQRVEALRQRLVHEKENTMERIQQERATALRKLTKKRQHGHVTSPKKNLKRDIIQEYNQFSSKVYAPVTRGGKAGKIEIVEAGIERDQFKQLDSLRELEAAVPVRMLLSSKQKPEEKSVRTAKERKQAAIEAHLLKMESMLKQMDESSHVATSTDAVDGNRAHAAPRSPSGFSRGGSTRKRNQQQTMVRPATPEYALHTEDDDEVANAVRLLQKLIRGRAVQNMMFEAKERRAELIHELRESDEAQEAHEALDIPSSTEEDMVASATMAKAEGEVISEMLDVLYKELDRSKEVAKMREFVEKAADERRKREVEEGGRRQAEDLVREREDEVYRRIERVHQETSADFIDDILRDVIVEQAHGTAMRELDVMAEGIGGIVSTLEDAFNSDEVIVKELVASFLLPHVQRQSVRLQVAQEQKKFVTAAHALLTEVVVRMKERPEQVGQDN